MAITGINNSGHTSHYATNYMKTVKKADVERYNTSTKESNENGYSEYLQGKYSYMNTGTTSMQGIPTTVSVSSAFLKKCMNDPEKAKYLEENLAAIPDCAKSAVAGCQGTLTNLNYQIDANGNISVAISGTNDSDGKIARENAERKVKEKKENSQTNEKHTVGQSVKLSISNEGLEYYRNRIQQSGPEKYDDVVQRKELLASKKISDIDYGYEIQKRAAQQNQNADTERSTLNITDKANSYVKAYAELYDEIVKGYENGTREIYVADENGPRKLTRDEELSNLDAAYKKTVDDFVTMETTNQHAREIIGEEMNKISKITSRSALASDYIEEQKTKGKDEIPENLTEKMYGAITSFKEKYTMIHPNQNQLSQLLMSVKI